jgi:hypothetical protein
LSSQIIPLTNAPDQSLSVSLEIDGGVTTINLRLRYLDLAGYWLMTVRDRLGNLLVDGVPVLTGYYPAANLLQQQVYLGIGSAYCINASGVAQDYPDDTNLGSDFILLWSDTPAL